MSGYTVEFTTAAARQIKKLPPPIRARILDSIEKLGDDPRPPAATKLVGEATAWRLRVGAYRVIYDIDDEVLTIVIVRASHRRDVYR